MVQDARKAEFEKNYNAFTALLPSLIPMQEGRFALMRNGAVVDFFDTPADALKAGRTQFGDGLFSVQTVSRKEADFGWFSRVPNRRAV
jgi:hypothetical protein